jgi:yecA family protein
MNGSCRGGGVDSDYERVLAARGVRRPRLAGWIDGFLTGVLAGPRAIAIDQWLPAMLGDSFARVFADPLDARQAQRALSSRWSELAQQPHAESGRHQRRLPRTLIVAYEDP